MNLQINKFILRNFPRLHLFLFHLCNLPRNIRTYFPALWNTVEWDYYAIVPFTVIYLEQQYKHSCMANGEQHEHSLQIKKALDLWKNYDNEPWWEQALKDFGIKDENVKDAFKRPAHYKLTEKLAVVITKYQIAYTDEMIDSLRNFDEW